MKKATHKPYSHLFSLILFAGAATLQLALPAQAALLVRVKDPGLRKRLARTYAPEIHQDQAEPYGLASIAYFLRRSKLRAKIRRCKPLGKRATITLGPGALVASPPPHGHFSWHHRSGLCRTRFAIFATKNRRERSSSRSTRYKRLAAPNRVFLQLDDHKPSTLLKKPHKRAIIPALSYHVYEAQSTSCVSRNLFLSCQEYKTRRLYVIQYFVTLMFNEACNEHEGEHEGMVVQLDANQFDWAKSDMDRYNAIEKIGLFGHYHTKIYLPTQLTFAALTHPIAYMGRGGHALYPTSGSTNLLMSFPRELRRVMTRACRKRKRFNRLTEHHRGGGAVYRTWQPPKARPGRKPRFPAATYLPPIPATARHLFSSQKALQPSCLLARGRRGVRLCDVQPNRNNPACCLKGRRHGYLPWVQFTGRWGRQEAFASSLAGAAASQVGRLLRRWPLARSMGNSGPFGPQWIHASTWRWRKPNANPAAASSLWR